MPKSTIILITLFLFINKLSSQQNTDSLLFAIEKQIFVPQNDTSIAQLILQKTSIYYNLGQLDSLLLNETERLNYKLLKDSLVISHFLWNTTLANYLNKNYNTATSYYNQYQLYSKNDTSLSAQLLSALIFMNSSKIQLKTKLRELVKKDSTFNDINCFQDVMNYEKKGKAGYLTASALLPGTGMIALKKPRQGITALALNSGSAFAIYSLAKSNLYFNAVTWGIFLTQKFYAGNIKLTEKLFLEKEEKQRFELSKQCEEKIKKLLLKYPLTLKK